MTGAAMSTAASYAAPSAEPSAERVHRGWIESPAFDLPCFVLSPVAGLLFLLVVLTVPAPHALLAQAAAFYFVAVPHYMSTYTFYLADDNLRQFRSRALAFFGGPAIIAVSVLLLWVLGFPPFVQALVFTWNIWHVVRQNCGIAAIYRRLHGGAQTEAGPMQTAFLGISGGMAFWNIDRFPPIGRTLTALHPQAAHAIAILLVAIGTAGLVALAQRLLRRERRAGSQEIAFVAASLVMFHPYLWVTDYTVATLGMLMGHFVQYLAVVWLLHRRKYRAVANGSSAQHVLSLVSTRNLLIVCFIAASGLFFIVVNEAAKIIGVPSVYTIAWFAFTLIHFYLDGLIWAFRRPFVRETVGAYLMPANRIVA